MIQVHHVVISLEPGGLENGVVNVVNGLDRDRFRSTVWCLRVKGAFAERIEPGAASVHELGWRGGNDLGLVLRLAGRLKAQAADIVHTRNAEAFYYGFAATRLNRCLALIHSEHGRTFDDRPLRWRVQRMMSRHTDAIFSVSEQLRADMERYIGIPRASVEVIHNGVTTAEEVQGARAVQRARLGLPPEAFVIGSVGRLVPVKNYPLLIRAATPLLARGAWLVLVGEGTERKALHELASVLGVSGQVMFTGHIDAARSLMAAFDVFVLPSISEGMSNTILEAMASGIPIIASDVGGNGDIIRDGVDGRLFASGDENGLRVALEQMRDHPQQRSAFGVNGRDRVNDHFTLTAMIRKYEALYTRVWQDRVRSRKT